jgi:hypothetical protein
MTDDELIAAFEAATLPAGAFPHREHVRAAWWYARRYPLHEARMATFLPSSLPGMGRTPAETIGSVTTDLSRASSECKEKEGAPQRPLA